MTGYKKMPRTIECAMIDIKHHLWTLYWLPRMLGARQIVELGVRSGDSTRAFLFGAQDVPTATYMSNGSSVTTYCEMQSYDIAGDAYRVAEVTEGHGIEWEGVRWGCSECDSVEAAKLWWEGVTRGTLRAPDIVFIDTDHSFETTRREIAAWHSMVRPGGVMVFHDVGLTDPGRDGVKPAMREFMAGPLGLGWTIEEQEGIAEGDTGLGILWKAR